MDKTAKELYDRAALLEEQARLLRKAANVMERASHLHLVSDPGKTQAEKLTEFLETRHGATRREMREESGLPEGTIASLLGARKQFAVDKKTMRWHPLEVKKLA